MSERRSAPVLALGFLWSTTELALGALWRNLGRSVLTAFGILIGVAAVTIVVALGDGARAAVSGKIDALGDNTLIIDPREVAQSGVKAEERLPPLTEGDAEALKQQSSHVVVVAPMLRGLSQIAWRDSNKATRLTGSTLPFFEARSWYPEAGRLWSESDEKVGAKVCVIGSTVRDDLFGTESPIGHNLRIGRYPFKIVGVLQRKGQSPFGADMDDVVVMPLSAMRGKVVPTRPGAVHRILVAASKGSKASRAKKEITQILRQRHRLVEGAENDFRIRSQEEFRKMQEQILGVLSALLLSIAAISLIVGGIGVMNIMLVSVTERTREIGLRMAIGAQEGDILLQFLVEALVLCLAGGLAGAVVAGLAISGLGAALDWELRLSWRALTVALGTSAAVGVTFGFLPARRAARVDPIQALHG